MGARAGAAIGFRRILDTGGDRFHVLLASFGGCRSRAPAHEARAAGEVAGNRVPAVRAVQYRRARWRIRNSVAAGAVALPPLQPVGSGGRYVFLRGWPARIVLAVHFGGARCALRPDQHDGVQSSAGERDADTCGVHADARTGDGPPAGAIVDVADGRSGAPVL